MFGEGLSKIVDAIRSAWEMLKPYAAIYPYEEGVVQRYGHYTKTLEPGYYFKWPIAEKVDSVNVALTTMRGNTQTINERTVKWTAKFRVIDSRAYICDILEEASYLRDCISANVADYLRERGDHDKSWPNMMRRLRSEVEEGGFEIVRLRLVDDTEVTFTHRRFDDVGEIDE